MWQFIRSRILSLIIFIAAVDGILVVGPKFIRANQRFEVVITNYQSNLTNVELALRMEGHTNNGTSVLNVTNMVDVKCNMNKKIFFEMPGNLSAGNYKIVINGQQGFGYHKEIALVYLGKSISGLIQTSKPVFKPGDTVKFRVIVLDSQLKPPAWVNTVHVTIRDPEENVIRKWVSAQLYSGVFESNLEIATTPMFGTWLISVLMNGGELVSKTFEVKEYLLSSFDVEVIPSSIPLVERQALNLTIAAYYDFKKPVNGLAKVELYLEDDILDQKIELKVYGLAQIELRFVGYFEVERDRRNVFVKTTFIKQDTDEIVVKHSQITVYKYEYGVYFIKDIPYFHPGLPFKCALQFRYHNGTIAKGITGEVKVIQIDHEKTATSDEDGLIKLELHPSNSTEEMFVTFVSDDGLYFYEHVEKIIVSSNAFIKLELKSPIKLDHLLQFMVTCNEPMTFFVYYVVTRGQIIESALKSTNNQKKYSISFTASGKMSPKAKIIVATIMNGTMLFDSLDVDFNELRNSFRINLNNQEVKPGQQIELCIFGRRKAYVGLAAHNNGLLYDKKNNDSFWEDVLRVYNGIVPNIENEFDIFHSMGLFVRTLDDIKFNEAHDTSARDGLQMHNAIPTTVSYRTGLPESWLWQNVTIGNTGKHTITEVVPDTTISWNLTVFIIDPEYGFGIIKKPIQFKMIQPFYIVENLPYSIKRYEVVELHFTLFNNLGEEYIADVTLHNVDYQMEFIERPLEDLSYTKTVSVPPRIGVPIAFLVKARKLGEIKVRVSAKVQARKDSYALEKVIEVIPESLVQLKEETRSFHCDTYLQKTFFMHLDISNKADKGSVKIEFRLNPNLLPAILQNLNEMLIQSFGNGEENMVKFVPNIVVLDYLHAIGSQEQSLFDKATNLLRQGYQNQMRYRQRDGSFGVWQNGGSVFLTAFVAKSMQTATKYISEVDAAMVEKAYDWLASKQHRSGRFDEVGSVIHQDMQGGLRNGIALTSYVLTALLENDNAKLKHADVIQNAMSYLSRQMETINNAYDLSIATYALMLNGHSMKDKAFKRLLEKSTITNNGTERYWTGEASDIETTAYALLSFVLAEKYVEGIPVMRWLMNQRYVTGSFPRTQDTFVGLKALTKLAEIITPSRNDYKITLIHNRNLKHFRINGEQRRSLNYIVPEDVKFLNVSVSGIGFGLFEVIYRYSISLENFAHRFNLDLKKQTTGSDNELRLKVCASFIPTISYTLSNMAMLEVNFPSGFVVDRNPISEQTTVNPIQLVQVRYGATSVVVYYDNMGRERNCFTVTAYRRFKVELKRPAYVVVYDSVNPKWTGIASYEVD